MSCDIKFTFFFFLLPSLFPSFIHLQAFIMFCHSQLSEQERTIRKPEWPKKNHDRFISPVLTTYLQHELSVWSCSGLLIPFSSPLRFPPM